MNPLIFLGLGFNALDSYENFVEKTRLGQFGENQLLSPMKFSENIQYKKTSSKTQEMDYLKKNEDISEMEELAETFMLMKPPNDRIIN